MLPKKTVFILIGVLVVLIAVIVVLGAQYISLAKPNPAGPSAYSAVYLASGDIYYGKLDWFPWPRLTNVWFLQRSQVGGQSQLGITPFKSAFWGPVDEIELNSRQIIFWTRLRNDSQVVKAFENPELLQQQPQPQQPTPPAGGPPSTNFQGPTSSPAQK